MRKITARQISVFVLYATLIGLLTVGSTVLLAGIVPSGDFRGVIVIASGVVLLYCFAFATYRLFLALTPLPLGDLEPGSPGEFAAQVNTLFYLIFFYSLTRTHFLPVPVLRLVYQALGARLGDNTYGGVILDPPLTTVGRNCIIGHDAVLFSHAIEGTRFSLDPIHIGDNVTIGAHAVIMSGVRIGDGAIVSAGAVVGKSTRIGAGEIWGGVPARLLRGASQGKTAAASVTASPE